MNTVATLQFLGACSQSPQLHGVTCEKDHCPLVEARVTIANARTLDTLPQLDAAGFTLVNSEPIDPSGTRQSITQQHLQQSERLLGYLTGAR